MHSTLADKLTDYLSGLRELKKTVTPPIGAVLVRESDRQATLDLCGQQGASVVSVDEHPDPVLEKVLAAMRKGAIAVIDVRSPLPPKLLAALNNIANGLFGFTVGGGDGQRRGLAPEEQNGNIIFVLSPEYFNAFPHQETVSSVCRLAYIPEPARV